MSLPPLLAAGLGCAALLLLYTGVRVIARRTAWTFFHFLLAALAVLLTFVGLTLGHASGETQRFTSIVAFTAIILVAAGLLFTLVQRLRNKAERWSRSSGIALTGVGLFFALTLLLSQATAALIPKASQQYTTVTLPDQTEQAETQLQNVASVGTANTSSWEQAADTSEPRRFVLTPLPTQYVYATPTLTETSSENVSAETTNEAVSTEASTSLCVGIVQNNLNLRSGPGVDYELILTIPYATNLSVHARSGDSTWLWVEYDSSTGWVSADYVTLNAPCSHLPVRDL